MKRNKTVLASAIGALFFAVLPFAQADEAVDSADAVAKIKAALGQVMTDSSTVKVAPSPVNGLYEAQVGMQVVYVSADGRYLLQGQVVDLENRENITRPRENALKAEAISAVDEDKMIIFGDKSLKHTITVFTDLDCGYCRKLHSEIQSYNDAGIRVRYMSFPRDGGKGDSTRKAMTVWCSDDRKDALTRAKKGEDIGTKECDNPVLEELALGQAMGINGTPAIVLENGELLPGYIPAAKLGAALDAKDAEPSAAMN